MQRAAAVTTVGTGIRDMGAEALITVGGIVTSIATVALNAVITRMLGLNLLSLDLWFVIPAGALCGGIAAASGYYFTALWSQSMPSRRLLFAMTTIGLSTWFLMHWIDYVTLTFDDGTRVSAAVGFWRYFQVATETMSLNLRAGPGAVNAGDTGALGGWGYGIESLQVIGFLGGGWACYGMLNARERCETCRKYATVRQLLKAVAPERFQEVLDAAAMSFPDLVEAAQPVLRRKPLVGLDLALARCPHCAAAWGLPKLVVRSGRSDERILIGRYALTGDQTERLVRAAAPRTGS